MLFRSGIEEGTPVALPVPVDHVKWVFGVQTFEQALAKLEGFKLDGVVQKMKCPFLLLHGAGDEQIPLAIAEKCFAAVGSKEKTLKVFHREEGGFHHCQVDNITIGTNYMDQMNCVPAMYCHPAGVSMHMPLARAAAQKAIELDPNSAEGHTSLATVDLSYDWNFPGAEQEFKRAIALNANYEWAHHVARILVKPIRRIRLHFRKVRLHSSRKMICGCYGYQSLSGERQNQQRRDRNSNQD